MDPLEHRKVVAVNLETPRQRGVTDVDPVLGEGRLVLLEILLEAVFGIPELLEEHSEHGERRSSGPR